VHGLAGSVEALETFKKRWTLYCGALVLKPLLDGRVYLGA
jgi:hypothetical protein